VAWFKLVLLLVEFGLVLLLTGLRLIVLLAWLKFILVLAGLRLVLLILLKVVLFRSGMNLRLSRVSGICVII
jgi:hypothetical protein